MFVVFKGYGDHRDLPSFPTRRSSDLQAIADYGRAIELDPTEAIFYYIRGNIYAALQDYRQAIADYSRAIELDPAEAIFYVNRANIYATLQGYRQAIVDLSRAIELDPENGNYYNLRANVYLSQVRGNKP